MVDGSFDDDLSCHPRVDRTEVRVSSCCREDVGEALTRFQQRRLIELIVIAHDDMRHIVVVGPGHRCADRYGECFWREVEIADDNLSLCSFGRSRLSGFGLLAAHSTQKGQSNEQNERQGARIQMPQKRREYGHAPGSGLPIVSRRN